MVNDIASNFRPIYGGYFSSDGSLFSLNWEIAARTIYFYNPYSDRNWPKMYYQQAYHVRCFKNNE